MIAVLLQIKIEISKKLYDDKITTKLRHAITAARTVQCSYSEDRAVFKQGEIIATMSEFGLT